MRSIKILSLVVLLVSLSFSISAFIKLHEPVEIKTKIDEIEVEPPLDPVLESYSGYFEKQMIECHCPGGVVSIVRDSQQVYIRGFGAKDIHSMEPIGENSIFRIGSLSKGFASVLTGMMVEKGFLGYDDPVVDHVPWFKLQSSEQTQRIRVKHILSHTTGLPIHSYTNLVEDGKSVEYITKELSKVRLLGNEGTIYAYQNAAYSIIEKILESTSKQSFDQLLQNNIFDPLEMHTSSTNYTGINSQPDKALPHRYISRQDKFVLRDISKKYYNSISSGGINSNISDMSKWLRLLLGHYPKIIKNETLDKVFTPFIKTSHANRYFNEWEGVKDSYYAFGWRIIDFESRRIAYHGGYVNGYRSEIAVDRENQIGICVMYNSPCEYAQNVIPEFFRHLEQKPDSVNLTLTGDQ